MSRTFTLLRTLGRGAHGSVHLAELRDEQDFVQRLAIKRLRPETAGPELGARLRDEARLLAMLDHPHIVRVHGLTRIDGALAILMEAVDGADLGRLMSLGPMPGRAAAELMAAVSDALEAAWTTRPWGSRRPLRVVHRDIKPSNVMITSRGDVKVMDFGVARASFEAREVQTQTQHLGTERYMAPERWLRGKAEHRSDVFSLGITVAELASGTASHRPRLSPDPFAEDVAHLLDRVPDAPLRDLLREMCAFEPQARPSAGEVATDARRLTPHLPGPTLRSWSATAVPSLPEADAPAQVSATVVAEEPLLARRRGAGWWAGLAVVVGGAAVAVAALEPAGPRTPPLSEPTPAPLVEPAGVEMITLAPEPVPPRRALVRRAAPPDSEPEVDPLVPVRFLVAPGLEVSTDFGAVKRYPDVLALPVGHVVQLRVREGDLAWSCTISVGESPADVFVAPQAEGGCRR